MPVGSGCTSCGNASSSVRVISGSPVRSARVISGSPVTSCQGQVIGRRSYPTRVYHGQACGNGTACGSVSQGTVIHESAIQGGVVQGGVVKGSVVTSGHPVSQVSYPHSSGRVVSARVSGATTTPMVSGSNGGVGNVLAALNSQRARQGLASLRYDAQLQAVAQRRAQQMAATGNKNHPPGSFSPGRYEGVGWSSSFSPSGVSACFTSDPRMTVAGAAMATGRDGVYFCVVYR